MLKTRKPRVCIVNPYEHGGGAEYQIALLIDALNATGQYEVHFLTHFVDARDRTRSYEVSRVGSGGPIPRLGYLMDARSLYGKLNDIDPCLIYQRVACAYTGICALYSRRRSVPLLWHVAHDTDVTPQYLDRSRNVLRLRLEKWSVEYGLRRATRIVVQTRHQAELLHRHYGRTADAVIPNFHPPASEPIDKSGPLTVVWIANLKFWKRPEVFVRLAGSFKGRDDVRFLMVGAPAAAAGELAWHDSLMRDIEATPNLRYLGHKTYEQVNELLARCHIFVNTSIHEGFPNTFVQAWLRDAVVVSLDVDPDRVLEQQHVGIAAHTEQELAAAVRMLIERPELRASYAARGREHASANHSLRNAEQQVRLIDSWRSKTCAP
jgi:glycosyltransferase involved in cell wall biosynthesis